MHTSPPYWPATSSQPTSRSTSSSTLVDEAAHSFDAASASVRVAPGELPALVAGKITQAVIDYLVDRVCDAVDFGLGRPSSSTSVASKHSRNHSRRWQSGKADSERAAFAGFVATVLRRAEVTLSIVIGALVYIDRARPHLSIAIEEWAHHRVLLGALIAASKYLNDASLKNAHWALCTGVFGRRDVQRIEREFLDVLDWELAVSEADLVRVCSRMVKEGVLVRPNVKAIEPVAVKEVHMEVDGLAEKKREEGSLRAVRALWDEKARREQLQHHHRPEKRAQADVDMDVDDYAEKRVRRRRSAYPSPASSDSCSTCTESSSPETDSDGSGSPFTPPPPHQAPRGHYALSNSTAKPVPHPTHTKSVSNGSLTFQPLAILDAFPAVPAPAPVPTSALALSPSPSRSCAAPVQAPIAPPPLPSLPPYPVFPMNRAFLSSHPHLHQRPHSARPASPYAKLSTSAGPGTGSRSRPLTPYSHKRSSALSTAPSLYPAYIPAVNV